MKKLPPLTLLYWIMIISANTIGETLGDFVSMTTGLGYGAGTLILTGLLLIALVIQIAMKVQHQALYWIVIILTSTAGTTMSDLVTREWFGNMPVQSQVATVEKEKATGPATIATSQPEEAKDQEKEEEPERYADYGKGVLLIGGTLAAIFIAWKLSAPRTHIEDPMNRFIEILYWAAILTSSTLGTAFGDFLADEHTGLKLGFGPSTLVLIGALAIVTIVALTTKLSRDWCYWAAIVVTHPLGATAGDLMTKEKERGGLELGNTNATLILTAVFILIAGINYMIHLKKQSGQSKSISN